MRRLGNALHVVQNRIIVRGEPVEKSDSWVSPRNNVIVVDQNRKKVGQVFDIFGPLKHPYIIVKPKNGIDATIFIGKNLYIEDMSRSDNKWKK